MVPKVPEVLRNHHEDDVNGMKPTSDRPPLSGYVSRASSRLCRSFTIYYTSKALSGSAQIHS